MKNKGTIFYLMIASMFIRLFWLAVFEPHGAKRAIAKTQQMGELAQFASTTISYVFYPSIIILICIIIYCLMRKRWAYLAGTIFWISPFYFDLNSCNDACFSRQRILGCYPIFARNDGFFISLLQETLRSS